MTLSMLKPTGRGVSGFSLVEVMIAMAIISLSTLAMLKLMIMTQKNNFRAREMTAAMVAVQEVTERFMALEYDSPLLIDGIQGTSEYEPFTVKGSKIDYTVDYTVEEGSWAEGTPTPNTKRIKLRVEYQGADFRKKTWVEAQIIKNEYAVF